MNWASCSRIVLRGRAHEYLAKRGKKWSAGWVMIYWSEDLDKQWVCGCYDELKEAYRFIPGTLAVPISAKDEYYIATGGGCETNGAERWETWTGGEA